MNIDRPESIPGKVLAIRRELKSGRGEQVLYQDGEGRLFRPGPITDTSETAGEILGLFKSAGIECITEKNGHLRVWTRVNKIVVRNSEGQQNE